MEHNTSDLVSYLFSQGKTLNEIRNLTHYYRPKKEKKEGKEMTLCQICNKYVSLDYYKFHLLSKKHIELDKAFVAIKEDKTSKLKKIEENPAESTE